MSDGRTGRQTGGQDVRQEGSTSGRVSLADFHMLAANKLHCHCAKPLPRHPTKAPCHYTKPATWRAAIVHVQNLQHGVLPLYKTCNNRELDAQKSYNNAYILQLKTCFRLL